MAPIETVPVFALSLALFCSMLPRKERLGLLLWLRIGPSPFFGVGREANTIQISRALFDHLVATLAFAI